jgi:hypothetical protein
VGFAEPIRAHEDAKCDFVNYEVENMPKALPPDTETAECFAARAIIHWRDAANATHRGKSFVADAKRKLKDASVAAMRIKTRK